MSKKKSPEGGLVYSTNPNFKLKEEVEEAKTPGASQQDLRVWLERKGGGKMVTLVKGFQGKLSDFDDLAKALNYYSGVCPALAGCKLGFSDLVCLKNL